MAHSEEPSTNSNYLDFSCKNISIKWTVDMSKKTLDGSSILLFDVLNKNANELNLDVSKLHIQEINNVSNNSSLKWSIKDGKLCKDLGKLLSIDVPSGKDNLTIEIKYSSDPEASALQWLDAAQTCGRKHSYMFSQCEEIHARSIVPCQDTPMIKSTFDAEVTAPSDFTVLMSGLQQENDHIKHSDGSKTFKYQQPVPIPTYLIAIACGHLDSRPIGPRSAVWSEPEMVDAAAWEFQETEEMIKIAEKLCNVPYLWKRYDLLVLPPTFPFGGMENPCLTFLTPTLLAGNRSLTNVVAHEISHSWTGNLVTNSSWEHFWLNEGHTVYLERLILGALEEKITGNVERGRATRHLHMSLGYLNWLELTNSLSENFNKLAPNLEGLDPDDYFSRVPYEKGSLFLFYLETVFGQDSMLAWLNAYLIEFSYKSLNSAQWVTFFKSFMTKRGVDASTLVGVNFDEWIHGAHVPDFIPQFDDSLSKECEHLQKQWISYSSDGSDMQDLMNRYNGMNSKQQLYFWQIVRQAWEKLSDDAVIALKQAYKVAEEKNAEILFEWCLLAIMKQQKEELPQILAFVNSNGRMKYLHPLYTALGRWPHARPIAIQNFHDQRPFMHGTSAKKVEDSFGLRT